MRYFKYLDTLQSEISAEVMFLPTVVRLSSQKLLLLMYYIPRIM